MSVPTLTIGLPVYNGEQYLAQALDALLAQTYTDFELVISDNASDDATEVICRTYAARDARIRYIRQPVNVGADPNHHFLVERARGKYFKWAADDDLYEPDLLRRCVDALESHPDVVLAHAADAAIDKDGELLGPLSYELDTANPSPSARLRSLLHVSGGNDDYGVMRTDVVRRIAPYGVGAYGSDRVFVASMLLQGPFHHVPQILYYRREHPERASQASKRDRAVIYDPKRSSRLRYPTIRLHMEYVWAFLVAIWRAPLTTAEKVRCWREVAAWLVNRSLARPVRAAREQPGRRDVTAPPLRVAAYGYFGMGNIGNEASLAAFLDYVRERHPEVTLSCYAAGPDQVEREHGVPATQLMSYRADPDRGGPLVVAAKAASRLRDVPRTFRMMGDVDLLVVPGTGVLETRLVATPWGLPYWLFLAALACRLRGREVVLLNVGAETPAHPVTRWLYRWTVRLTTRCTYRDAASRNAVRSMGVRGRGDGVYPDLVFRLPAPTVGAERPGHVVLGVMAFEGGPEAPSRGPGTVRTYVSRTTDLVTRLVDAGRTVTVVVGDLADHGLATEIAGAVRAARPDLAPRQVSVSDASTVHGIMREMGTAEVVLASRFHNVICALKMTRPTVSLGYAEKNAHVLAEFGLDRFSQPMESLDVDRLVEQVEEVGRVHPSLEGLMKETLRRYEDQLDEELDEIIGELLTPRPGRVRQMSSAVTRRLSKR